MKFVMFYHSLVSDWNHGNAHFLRGVVRELLARGHGVRVLEPRDGWSRSNLEAEHGADAVRDFHRVFPGMSSQRYDLDRLDLDAALDDADVVVVHEWNSPALVERIGRHRSRGGAYRLLFHDTHHRATSAPAVIDAFDLGAFDGVLAFGEAIREIYLRKGWARRAWTWHEAADITLFRPIEGEPHEGDLVWIGNWGDDERTAELQAFLLQPAAALGLRTRIYGVRYPEAARRAVEAAGVEYAGWIANHKVPCIFARFGATVHVPRRPYVEALPGIPTIRMFEALACGIPLICAPWSDAEGLFRPGDYLAVADGAAMQAALRRLVSDPALAAELAANGLRTVRERHTCRHRVEQLLDICRVLHGDEQARPARRAMSMGVH